MRHRIRFIDLDRLNRDLNKLKLAVYESYWLLKRGYKKESVINFVSNHYQLLSFEREILQKAATLRYKRGVKNLKDKKIFIDGFNILITAEASLAKSLIIKCSDGCYRDLSSVHGSYRFVYETKDAINIILDTLQKLNIKEAVFVFDKNVSNSIKISNLVKEIGKNRDFSVDAVAIEKVDNFLKNSEEIVATCDSAIIKNLKKWFNLSAFLLENVYKNAKVLDLDIKKDPRLDREGK